MSGAGSPLMSSYCCRSDEDREAIQMEWGFAGNDDFGDGELRPGGEVEFNMDQVEEMEINKTNDLLLESDYRPYMEQCNFEMEYMKKVQEKLHLDRPRYFSIGYEANADPPDNLEIARWQKYFNFLHVVGEGLTDCYDGAVMTTQEWEVCTEEKEPTAVFETTRKRTASLDLCIFGKKMKIEPLVIDLNSIVHDAEEIFCQDGILEECLAVDNSSPWIANAQEIDTSVEVELENSSNEDFMESLWVRILPSMQPIVRKVVSKSNELKLPSNIVERKSNLAKLTTEQNEDVEQDSGFW
jgi:hypothetical protein